MRTFTEGQTVYVRRRYGDKYDPRYDKKIVKGIMRKNPAYYPYSWRIKEYLPDPTGNFVMVSDQPTIRTCWKCDGLGKYLPEGFDPEASYRKPCETCNQTGQVTSDPYCETIMNRKDWIMSEEEYAPVLEQILARDAAKKQGELAKKERENSLIKQLVDIVLEAEDKEFAAAEFIGKWAYAIMSEPRSHGYVQQSELYWAANKVRENRREAKKLVNS